ncbi:MAG TPA: ribonuclease III [Armatimonadota bacterium]
MSEHSLPCMEESLLRQAFSHPSYVREHQQPAASSNQRLELLGDAVLDLIIAEYLYEHYPEDPEGELTRHKAALVRKSTLAQVAGGLGLGDMLLLGRGEEETGGRRKASLLADAMEALIGAIYLAGEWPAAREFVLTQFGPLLRQEAHTDDFDYKSQLQEAVQSYVKALPVYETVRTTGPPHERMFEAEVRFGEQLLGRGEGHSKRGAEQRAAQEALEHREAWIPLLRAVGEAETSGEEPSA